VAFTGLRRDRTRAPRALNLSNLKVHARATLGHLIDELQALVVEALTFDGVRTTLLICVEVIPTQVNKTPSHQVVVFDRSRRVNGVL